MGAGGSSSGVPVGECRCVFILMLFPDISSVLLMVKGCRKLLSAAEGNTVLVRPGNISVPSCRRYYRALFGVVEQQEFRASFSASWQECRSFGDSDWQQRGT